MENKLSSSSEGASASVQLINIRAHVPATLDFNESNYKKWSTFFELTFSKFSLSDHINGTADVLFHISDAEWLQIDDCIKPWIYTMVITNVRNTML